MSEDPSSRAKAIVEAVTFYNDAEKLANISYGLKKAMAGLDIAKIPEEERMQERGW
jgi:pyridoxal 5'-phosphate synthase pdxS subunit